MMRRISWNLLMFSIALALSAIVSALAAVG